MTNKNNMKKYIIALCLIIVSSCNESKEDIDQKKIYAIKNQSIINDWIIVLEYDSCEYLYGPGGYGAVLTHKGNCKYCLKRK